MISHDFKMNRFDSCIYLKRCNDESFMYLLLYVDDMLIGTKSKEEIRTVKAQLNNEFEMRYLEAAKKILRMEILKDRVAGRLSFSQKGYFEKVLRKFNMQNTKLVTTPLTTHFRLSSALCLQLDNEVDYMSRVPYSSVVGSLMYAMVCSRPNLANAISVINRYMEKPGKEHWKVV